MRADPRPQRGAQAAAALMLLTVCIHAWQNRRRRLTFDRALSMSPTYARSLTQLRY
jgi:hypothetical protein